MPSSFASNVPTVVDLLHQADERGMARRVLDVGPGMGKYGVITREHLPKLLVLDALEVWEPYVDQFRWVSYLYDRVWLEDMRTFSAWADYDLILLIDVIEHIPLLDGCRILQRLATLGCAALVSTPRHYPQGPSHGNPYEAHVSEWTDAALRNAWHPKPQLVADNERSLIRLLL